MVLTSVIQALKAVGAYDYAPFIYYHFDDNIVSSLNIKVTRPASVLIRCKRGGASLKNQDRADLVTLIFKQDTVFE